MSVKVEKTSNTNELKLEFEIEAKLFEDAMKTVYTKNAKYFAIPGFRKGKAPYNIVEKQYGAEIFYEDAFNELVPDIYDKELKDNNIDAVSAPHIDITQMEKGKDLIFTAIVQTKPEVKVEKYTGIEIKKIEYNVSDEDVNNEIEKMAEQNARLVSVEDRPVAEKDIAVIDFEGFIDGVAFEGGKAENHELEIGSHSFIDGFESQVVGMKVGEEKDIKVTFPKEYFSEDLAGKDAVFKVKVNEIKKKELPEIDDELAKDISEFDTLKELKDSIKEKLQKSNDEKAKRETEDAIIKAIADKTEIDIPSGMIDSEIDRRIQDMKMNLSYRGLKLDQYLQLIGKTEAELRKENEETAKEAVKTSLILEAIAEDAKMEAEEKDIDAKLEELSKAYGKTVEELKKNEELVKYVTDNLKLEKTIEYLVKNAKIK